MSINSIRVRIQNISSREDIEDISGSELKELNNAYADLEDVIRDAAYHLSIVDPTFESGIHRKLFDRVLADLKKAAEKTRA